MEFTGERYIPDQTDEDVEIEHMQRYNSIKELIKGKVVLDAACGEGYGARLLSTSAREVHGVDIDQQTIELAKRNYRGIENLHFQASQVQNMPYKECYFDVVVSFETLEHMDEDSQESFILEIKRVLKQDGIFIISTPNKKYYSDIPNYLNPFHVKELYREEFDSLLNKSFNYVIHYSQNFEVVAMINHMDDNSASYINLDNSNNDFEKYMIAVCSDVKTNAPSLNSVKLYKGKYNFMTDRILQLQDEVDERNNHIGTLDKEIAFLRKKFENAHQLKTEINNVASVLEQANQLLTREVSKNNEQEKERVRVELQNQELMEKLEEFESLNYELQTELSQYKEQSTLTINLERHIEQLLEQERKLHNIYNSGGWKLLENYYKMRDWVFPLKSKRRLIAKLAFKVFKNPSKFLSKMNKTNFKKFKYYLKAEDGRQLENRINDFFERHSEHKPSRQIKLFNELDFNKIDFEPYKNPKVSIIIPVFNQWEYTYSCLLSIKENTSDVTYEVIVADDMSTDETIRIGNFISNVTVVRDGENRGFLLNCNHAAEQARGEYIFFLNNDTNVQPGWLSSLVGLVESDTSIGMVGSKLIYPDGRQQEAGGIIWNDASGWNYGRLDDPDKAEYNYIKEVDYISGAAVLIRHTLWKEIGGFDERYVPAYFEDTDLAFEVRNLGYKVVFQPQSVIVHFEGVSHGTDTNSGVKKYQIDNKMKFFEKWSQVLNSEHFPNSEDVFWARDRSRNKPTVVIVDHYVPHYDKDAGGRCTYFYIKLMVSLGFHVVFIGDNFFRHEPYTSELQQMGVEVLYGNDYAKNINKWIKTNGKYIDYVYLNRPHISIKYIDLFKQHTNAKIIYFGHDLHYIRELRNYELTKNLSLLKSSEEWKEIEFTLFEKADVIHVVGSYEQEVLKREFPDKPIRNIPLFPYESLYSEHHNIPRFNERKDLLFVGGFNHKPNYDGIMWFLNDIFPSITQSIPDLKIFIVGSNPPDELKEKSKKNIIVTGFVTDEELEGYYRRSKVVVVPLRFGAGVKGKVVESLYYQVPVVTTSIGAEGLLENDNVMSISDTPIELAEAVINLYTFENQWEEYSIRSKSYVKEHFTLESAKNILSLDMMVQETAK
ncbi:glycosyltransferase [Paenibacillus sp. JSM ZJ436]|uniref:glycosyltransferase n=1 Tax=Paenibacillus sp. JSM ZJ436 TaxID=3376190 RepID=UPI0037B10C82